MPFQPFSDMFVQLVKRLFGILESHKTERLFLKKRKNSPIFSPSLLQQQLILSSLQHCNSGLEG